MKFVQNHLHYCVIALFFSIYFLIEIFFIDYSFQLSEIPKGIISQATVEGIDIGKRVSLFYKILLSGTILFLVFAALFNYLTKAFQTDYNQKLLLLGIIGIISEISTVIGTNSEYLNTLIFWILIYFGLNFFIAKKNRFIRLINSKPIFPFIVSIGSIITYLLYFLFGSNELLRKNFHFIFISSLLLTSGYFWVFLKLNISFKKGIKFLLPASLIPIITFISIETWVFLKNDSGPSVYTWFFILLIAIPLLV